MLFRCLDNQSLMVDSFLAGKQHPPLWLAASSLWVSLSMAEASAQSQVSADGPAIPAVLTVFHSQPAAPHLADVLTSTFVAG